jgi:hypothetical protein
VALRQRLFDDARGAFVHLFGEKPVEKDPHAQHKNNSTDAHEAIVGGKQIGQQLHRHAPSKDGASVLLIMR